MAWLEDIDCVFARDPAARNRVEVLLSYPGVHAILWHRLNFWLWQRGLKTLSRLLSNIPRWYTGIEIHPGATIGKRFFIDHGMGVVIGETSHIGDDCTLYHGVTLGGTSWNPGKRHPTLKNGVVVGAGAKVLGPITLGENARVGSNAVVVKDVPDNTTVVGIPGHVVSRATPEELQKRKTMADKVGFDAYGASSDMPDPVAKAFDKLLDHLHAMDEQMQMMEQAIERLGGERHPVDLPQLDKDLLDQPRGSPEKQG